MVRFSRGLQVDPTVSEDDAWEMLQRTKTPFREAGIVDPGEFVSAVRRRYAT